MNNENLNNSKRVIASSTHLGFYDAINPQSAADLRKYGDNCVHSFQQTPSIALNQVTIKRPWNVVLPKLFDTEMVELETGFAKIFRGGYVR